ncbi:MAG: Leucyl-tRNA ligase LeuS [candidate division WWE3 bacterium GW2011_GWC1_47_10]|uniref:Leucine--tRNA ligase n=3 Tax=Katanobacteria TaxID=422282 RepID=A0A0G1R1A3_UNCKA|nr:MAG: Leucyl-tRNA ligase LeuS [candidate division WWE3 bacterium GW2011_GWC1_47_10]
MSTHVPHKIEPKWQEKWHEAGVYRAGDSSKKPKSYVLIEFPYPSGERLHVGHARSYCALDTVARLRRMKGMNVLYPIGWDAFGLPAENYAIKTGIHPSITTLSNIANAKKQLLSWGISFDWSREINTSDPKYYKWTQWIFLQLYKAGLAYRSEIAVNWCPACKINLANEEVVNGACERCGHATQRRMQKQWLLRITKYADRLLQDLDTVDYRYDIKMQQTNWIGKKDGVNISYNIDGVTGAKIVCFTTRPDTNFGATFVVLAPEHILSRKIPTKEYKAAVDEYVANTMKKSELERISAGKEKTGVFTGRYAVNPLNAFRLPIYVSDFVLADVGTGALVGVPAHDRRDFEFAKAFDLPVKVVVAPTGGAVDGVFEGFGVAINSSFLNGMSSQEAIEAVTKHLEAKGWGERAVSYHLRDWVFSRQHYWGEPIPIIHCGKCGEVPVPENELPLELPHVEKYQPTDTGESPLAVMTSWVNVACPKCGGKAKRETDTMPNWAGSSWYFLRYTDPNNDRALASPEKLKRWLPVDWYNGGMEHTTLHLLYSRFWHKFLYDQGFAPTPEPYAKRTSHGVVLGPDGAKMSKSKGNVINPDDIVEAFGADTLRMYMMFIGPFEQNVAWSNESVQGVKRFLTKAYGLAATVVSSGKGTSSAKVLSTVNRLVKKVEEDLEEMKFNTAVSAYMECVNALQKMQGDVGLDAIKLFVQALAPCAPHLAEELWEMMGERFSIHTSIWPSYDKKLLRNDIVTVVVQVNGKTRTTLYIEEAKAGDEGFVKEQASSALKMREFTGIRCVFVSRRLINFVSEK